MDGLHVLSSLQDERRGIFSLEYTGGESDEDLSVNKWVEDSKDCFIVSRSPRELIYGCN